MNTSIDPARRLLRMEEALEAANAGGREIVGRQSGYREIQEYGTFLGVPVLRAGRKILIPRKALENVLDGAAPVLDGGDDAA